MNEYISLNPKVLKGIIVGTTRGCSESERDLIIEGTHRASELVKLLADDCGVRFDGEKEENIHRIMDAYDKNLLSEEEYRCAIDQYDFLVKFKLSVGNIGDICRGPSYLTKKEVENGDKRSTRQD